MEHNDGFSKIAVLIDADNTQRSKLKAVFDEISTHGRIVVKKAYGDWKNPQLKHWEDDIKQLAINPQQQHAYVTGKNATDIALIIDAMDLLYTGIYDAFVIVSSDSDFTPLAIRLRESGVYVLGVGEEQTPVSFRNSCDEFIFTKYLVEAAAPEVSASAAAAPAEEPEAPAGQAAPLPQPEAAPVFAQPDDIHALLRLACDKYQNEDGFCNVASAGHYIKRARPDFDIRNYGVSKLPAFLEKYPDQYELAKIKGKGKNKTPILAYRYL